MSHGMREVGNWASYRQEDNVGIWEIEDWKRLFEEEIEAAERHYQEIAGQPEITATVVVFDEVSSLSGEMQDHITDAWSQLAQAVEIEKAAYVADGIAAMAVTANVEAPNVELDSFESEQEAVAWASS